MANALRAANRAMALQSPTSNAMEGPSSLYTLAQVQLRAGQGVEATRSLRTLMQMPAGTLVSARLLRLDPDWDALRGTPEFDTLLRDYPLPP